MKMNINPVVRSEVFVKQALIKEISNSGVLRRVKLIKLTALTYSDKAK